MPLNLPCKKIGELIMKKGDHDGFTIYEHVDGDISIKQDFGFDVEMTRSQVEELIPILVDYLNKED